MNLTHDDRDGRSIAPGHPTRPHILVTAAVIERDGLFLVARRLPGTHLAGLWEFPGGKCHDEETAEESLVREIMEELGAGCAVGPEILRTTHHYPERSVELRFFRGALLDDPRAMLGQQLRWVTRTELASLSVPPADEELVRHLVDGTL